MADMDSALACTKPFSDLEEEFFRVGDEMDAAYELERLPRLPTEELIPEPDDDDWEQIIAVARARV